MHTPRVAAPVTSVLVDDVVLHAQPDLDEQLPVASRSHGRPVHVVGGRLRPLF